MQEFPQLTLVVNEALKTGRITPSNRFVRKKKLKQIQLQTIHLSIVVKSTIILKNENAQPKGN